MNTADKSHHEGHEEHEGGTKKGKRELLDTKIDWMRQVQH